jgi:hypothetical protein
MLRRNLAVLVLTLAGLVLALSGCTLPTSDNGGGYGPDGQLIRTKPEPAPTPLKNGVPAELQAKDSTWLPGSYVVPKGATVELKVVNGDQTQHSFTLQGGSVSQIIPAGGQTLVKFAAPSSGKVRFYCKYQQQEMQGWITVT